jgi:hypothetical protein
MTVSRSVADVLADHVTLEVECIDRMYLNVYVPKLQFVNGVVHFLREHRGHRFASSALLEPISRAFTTGIHRFAQMQGVPIVDFAKGQRKDDVAHEYLARFDGTEGCCSSVEPRNAPACSAPRSAATRRPDRRIRGSCSPQR